MTFKVQWPFAPQVSELPVASYRVRFEIREDSEAKIRVVPPNLQSIDVSLKLPRRLHSAYQQLDAASELPLAWLLTDVINDLYDVSLMSLSTNHERLLTAAGRPVTKATFRNIPGTSQRHPTTGVLIRKLDRRLLGIISGEKVLTGSRVRVRPHATLVPYFNAIKLIRSVWESEANYDAARCLLDLSSDSDDDIDPEKRAADFVKALGALITPETPKPPKSLVAVSRYVRARRPHDNGSK